MAEKWSSREEHDIAYLASTIVELQRLAVTEGIKNDGSFPSAGAIAGKFSEEFIRGPRCCGCNPLIAPSETEPGGQNAHD